MLKKLITNITQMQICIISYKVRVNYGSLRTYIFKEVQKKAEKKSTGVYQFENDFCESLQKAINFQYLNQSMRNKNNAEITFVLLMNQFSIKICKIFYAMFV